VGAAQVLSARAAARRGVVEESRDYLGYVYVRTCSSSDQCIASFPGLPSSLCGICKQQQKLEARPGHRSIGYNRNICFFLLLSWLSPQSSYSLWLNLLLDFIHQL